MGFNSSPQETLEYYKKANAYLAFVQAACSLLSYSLSVFVAALFAMGIPNPTRAVDQQATLAGDSRTMAGVQFAMRVVNY